MSTHSHAVVWIDHDRAEILSFGRSGEDRQTIHAAPDVPQVHHHANSIGSGKRGSEDGFFDAVTKALDGFAAILVTGPSNARHAFARHLREAAPELAARIAGNEAADHPSEGELLARGREFFAAADRMTPQR